MMWEYSEYEMEIISCESCGKKESRYKFRSWATSPECESCVFLRLHWERYKKVGKRSAALYCSFLIWAENNYPRMKLYHFRISSSLAAYLYHFAQDTYGDYWDNPFYYQGLLVDFVYTLGHEFQVYKHSFSNLADERGDPLFYARCDIARTQSLFVAKNNWSCYSKPKCAITEKERLKEEKEREEREKKVRKQNRIAKEKRKRKLKKKKEGMLNQWYKLGYSRGEIVSAIEGDHTPLEWEAVKIFYGNKCLCCGSRENITKDHVIPVTWEGSSNSYRNLQPLCKSCNSSKGNYHSTDYRKTPLPDTSKKLLLYTKKAS